MSGVAPFIAKAVSFALVAVPVAKHQHINLVSTIQHQRTNKVQF